MEKVSQETNDKDEEYDDSRGSINVIYLRKLRELEEQVKEKEWKVERLEKENYQLERQLEKWERLGANNKVDERKLVMKKDASSVQNEFPLTR